MVICPLCRSEHHLPNNGFFPPDRKSVNLLEIISLSNTTCCKVLPDKRGKKILQKFCRIMSANKKDSFPLTYFEKNVLLYRQVSYFIKKRS